jgi:hypothetical protein
MVCAGRSRLTDTAHFFVSIQEIRARDSWHIHREAIFACWLSVMNRFIGWYLIGEVEMNEKLKTGIKKLTR